MDRRLILPLLLLATLPIQAEVYKWTDAGGNIHFGDAPPDKAKSQTVDIRVNTYAGTPVTEEEAPPKEPPKEVAKKASKESLTLYSTEWCGYCKQAKSYFRKNNIPFTEIDIEKSSSGRQEYAKMGSPGLPTIICGKSKMTGFSAKGFESTCGTH